MSNEIFGVDIAATVGAALGGNLHPLSLYKITTATGDYGEPIETATTYPGEGVRLSWDSKTAIDRGFPVNAAKLIVLQDGLPTPAKGDLVEILGDVWRVVDVMQDPVNATWKLAAVLETGLPAAAGTTPAADGEFVITWGE